MYLNELVELRNHISHLSHKKEDYNIKKNNNHSKSLKKKQIYIKTGFVI